MIRGLFALCVLLAFFAVSALLFSAFPFFLPCILGSLALLALFILGVFVLGWALLIAFPLVLSGLFVWMLLWLLLP